MGGERMALPLGLRIVNLVSKLEIVATERRRQGRKRREAEMREKVVAPPHARRKKPRTSYPQLMEMGIFSC